MISILGPAAVGKTSFHQFLREGTLPGGYAPTTHKEDVSWTRRKIEELDLKILRGHDVGGGEDTPKVDWTPLITSCDILIYMVRLKWLNASKSGLNTPEISRVLEDFEFIYEELEKRRKWPVRVLLVTGVDEDSEYVVECADLTRLRRYERNVLRQRATIEIVIAAGGLDRVMPVFGSLADLDWAGKTTLRVFTQIAELKEKAKKKK